MAGRNSGMPSLYTTTTPSTSSGSLSGSLNSSSFYSSVRSGLSELGGSGEGSAAEGIVSSGSSRSANSQGTNYFKYIIDGTTGELRMLTFRGLFDSRPIPPTREERSVEVSTPFAGALAQAVSVQDPVPVATDTELEDFWAHGVSMMTNTTRYNPDDYSLTPGHDPRR